MNYIIDNETFQANCFWFEPKALYKQPDGNAVCILEFCPVLKGREMEKDEHVSGEKWEFNEDVARVFDDMLQRSIPQYEVMRQTVHDIAIEYMKNETAVVDLGCARGEAIGHLAHMFPKIDFFGLDMSDAMLSEAGKRFENQKNVNIIKHDLKNALIVPIAASVIFSVLTIQFTPIEYRMQIMKNIYDQLEPGGCLILVEKVLGESAELDVLFRERYHALKRENGYSKDDIDRKKLALSGVLVPITAKWNESMMRSAGFRQVDCFWRWMNFAGWVAVK